MGKASKIPAVLTAILLVAALTGGVAVFSERVAMVREWNSAPPARRDEIRYGISGPAIEKVRLFVPEGGALLLHSGLDPALLPYYLFPRRIYQTGTDPETNAIYMQLPPPSYASRPAASFPVEATLSWHGGNWERGGDILQGGREP